MAESLPGPCPNPERRCDTAPDDDHPPALDARRTVIGSGAVFLDGTIVNVALKHIGEELPATIVGVLEGQTYIVSGYLAILAALLILAGALSDHYGRRRVYAIGLAGFAATSALCGLAPTLEWLVVFRLLQGAAGALLVPGSLALITHALRGPGAWPGVRHLGGLDVRPDRARPDRRRPRSSTRIGWRVAFLINVPLLAFALWATLTHVQESRDTEATGRFDWLGAIVAALAVGGLAFGVIRGQANAWQDPRRGSRSRSASSRSSPSRSSWPGDRTRSCRSRCSGRGRSRRSTSRRSSSTAPCT